MSKVIELPESDADWDKFVPCDHCGHFYRSHTDRLWEVAVRVVVRGNP